MHLYHVITTYHLLSAMTMQAASSEKGVLLMSVWVKMKYPNYESLKKIFDQVIVYDAVYRYKNDREETVRYFTELLPFLNECTEIFVWGAHYSFGIFITEQEIPFVFCEEAAGMHSRIDILQHIDDINPKVANLYSYVKELGLYSGQCKMTKTILCNFAAQLDGFQQENMMDFRVVETLMKLPEEQLHEIVNFFLEFRQIHVPKQSTIIFTQHLANLRLTTFNEQALIYQLLVDYFFSDRPIVIKPHPDDIMYYSRLFPDATIVRERFPSEFLPFLLDNQPQCVATIYSTAIYNLRGIYPDVFELDARFEKEFSKIHRYYVALQIVKNFGEAVAIIGTYNILLRKLAEIEYLPQSCSLKPWEITSDTLIENIIMIDDITLLGEEGRKRLHLHMRKKDAIFIFINSQADFCWYDLENKEFWEHIVPVVMQKKKLSGVSEDIFFSEEGEEILYVYARDKKILERIRNMEINKELSHTGVKLEKENLSEKEEHIKILEGILSATEKRLLYYINRVKELENGSKKE